MRGTGENIHLYDNELEFTMLHQLTSPINIDGQELDLLVSLKFEETIGTFLKTFLDYYSVFELIATALLFIFISRSLLKLLRKIYYSLFA